MRWAIGRLRHARFGANRSTPSEASTSPAAPTPIASTSGDRWAFASSTILAMVASSSSAGVGALERSTIVPSRATRKALILVPPTSIPMAWSPPTDTASLSEPEERPDAVERPHRVVVDDRLDPGPAAERRGHGRLDDVGDAFGGRAAGGASGRTGQQPAAGRAPRARPGHAVGYHELADASDGERLEGRFHAGDAAVSAADRGLEPLEHVSLGRAFGILLDLEDPAEHPSGRRADRKDQVGAHRSADVVVELTLELPMRLGRPGEHEVLETAPAPQRDRK